MNTKKIIPWIIGAVVILGVILFGVSHKGSIKLGGGGGEPSGFDNIALTGGLRTGSPAGDLTVPQSTGVGVGLSTISFNNLISGQILFINGCSNLTSLSFPVLADAWVIHIQGCAALTTLSFPNFVQTYPSPMM